MNTVAVELSKKKVVLLALSRTLLKKDHVVVELSRSVEAVRDDKC